MKKKNRYRRVEGKSLIEARVKTPLQLFDARDPSPFRERDLDDDFVEYILATAQEFTSSAALKILIHIEERETAELPRDSIKAAIHSYLSYRVELLQGELRRFLRRAQIFALIGLFVLGTCLWLAQGLQVPEPPGWVGILREGLVIFGWVSIWKPIELILFDWYPMFEKIRLYRKLLQTDLDIRFNS